MRLAVSELFLGLKLEVILRILIADPANDGSQQFLVCRISSVFNPLAEQTAENTAEVFMSRIAQERTAVCQHANKSSQIAQIGKTGQLICHALEMIIEPPGGTMLNLADGIAVLEASADRINGLVVSRIEGIQNGLRQAASQDICAEL